MLQTLLYVALGGAVGSVLRWGMGLGLTSILPIAGAFPWGTLAANTLGCFLAGGLLGLPQGLDSLTPAQRAALLTGFLGGLTTFSSLLLETAQLWQVGQQTLAIANVGISLGVGVVALWGGFLLVSTFWPWR